MTAFVDDKCTAVPKATCCRLDHETGKVENCSGENRGRAYTMEAVVNGIKIDGEMESELVCLKDYIKGRNCPSCYGSIFGVIDEDGSFVVKENAHFVFPMRSSRGKLLEYGIVDVDAFAGQVFTKKVLLSKPKPGRRGFNFGREY